MTGKLFFLTSLLAIIFSTCTYSQDPVEKIPPPFLNKGTAWVDSVLSTMTPDERIAQLIYIATNSNKGIDHEVKITDIIRKHKVGGLIFFGGTAERQVELTNFYQSESDVPLHIVTDAEWGLGMRLTDVLDFPFQMTLGAIQDDSLIYEMGSTIAEQCKRLGVHINLAPVVDINNNPMNPVISFRSFGEDRDNVTSKATMYMQGLQDNGILAVAKHFPGHGDTDKDSHFVLPILNHSMERLDSIELYPYEKMIDKGLGGIMTGHLNIPVLDSTRDLASSLSKPVVTGLLKEKLGFQGLIISDALNMKAVTNYFSPGISDAKALIAGNDILEFTADVDLAIKEIKNAIIAGKTTQEEVDERCRRILAAKYWAGLNNYKDQVTESVVHDLNSNKVKLLNRELFKRSFTVLRNNENLIPVQNLESVKIASLSIGSSKMTSFKNKLGKYTRMKHFHLNPKSDPELIDTTLKALAGYDLVIVGVGLLSQKSFDNYGVTEGMKSIVNRVISENKTIVSVFGNAYSLNFLEGIEESSGLIITYQNIRLVQDLTAQMIFGGFSATGRLPVTVNRYFSEGDGLDTDGNIRFQYSLPESVGMNSEILLNGIDSIVNFGLDQKAYPGCQVFVARKGVVVFHKTYGYHTYDKLVPVKKDDLYDFASVTKITGPLPAMMKLHTEQKYSLDEKFSSIWPDFSKGDKSEMLIREVLAHQARLTGYIVYWTQGIKEDGKFKWRTFSRDSSATYNVRVYDNIYLHKSFRKKIYKAIKKSPLREKNEYLYSGLSFILYPKIVEDLTGRDYETYLKETFYRPLGAYTITYNPNKEFPMNRIIPTENDIWFRKEIVQGWVHDEAAATMGGVSGNAGLFASINDLGKLMQMYLQMGTYGGKEYIGKETMKTFTTYQYPENNNRRGLGFDKPNIGNPDLPFKEQYPAASASTESFGHSGFTGTFTWVDPAYDLVYIFFSNRVYPTRDNQKLYRTNIRTKIQQVLYDAIEK